MKSETRRPMPFRDALMEGWSVTFGVALMATLWVLAGYWISDGANVQKVGLPLSRILVSYAIAAVLSGIAHGLTRPLRYRFWGRVLSGVVVGWIVGAVLAVTVDQSSSLGVRVASVLIYGLLIGGGWGAVWMRRPDDSTYYPRSDNPWSRDRG